MTLGKKIKSIRTGKKITQAKLCDGKITRNMLSEIECDKASPSLATLKYIANRLGVSVSLLLSEEDDAFFFEKKEKIGKAKEYFKAKNYTRCIELLDDFDSPDDEISYILAYSYFERGKYLILRGSLVAGLSYLGKANSFCKKTIYDTTRIESLALLYSALAKNIQSPLMEFDTKCFFENVTENSELEFYRYITQDYGYEFKNPVFCKHVEAKELMKNRKYHEAVSLLTDVENLSKANYNAYVVFSVYYDLENCYKQLLDFENAYRYASKRLSLIEAFKS